MIDTTIEIFSSNTQSVNVYDSDTGTYVTTPTKTLAYRERNTSTSLVLHGDSAFNYGQDLLTNLVHLTENFSNVSSPSSPILGQKYYNPTTKSLSIYDGDWSEIAITENNDILDIVYETSVTSNHSSHILQDFLSTLIPSSGNSVPATVTLSGLEPTLNNEAVTKKYADSVLLAPAPYLPRTGYIEMQGKLLVADTLRSGDDDTVVNVKYVNELGTVDTENNNEYPEQFRVTTYCDIDRKTDSGVDVTTPWYTVVWFHGTIIDTASDATIELPVSFITASSASTNYVFSAIAVCTSVDTNVKLNVSFVNGSNIKVKRDGTTGAVKFCGNIYGYRART
jgi:hypothetical protein